MNPKIVKELAAKYYDLARLYREAAEYALSNGHTFDVYLNIKESLAMETKIRALKMRHTTSD